MVLKEFVVDLRTGAQLGSYTIEKLLGMGGMGKVYLAHDKGLKRRAALKVLRKNYVENGNPLPPPGGGLGENKPPPLCYCVVNCADTRL